MLMKTKHVRLKDFVPFKYSVEFKIIQWSFFIYSLQSPNVIWSHVVFFPHTLFVSCFHFCFFFSREQTAGTYQANEGVFNPASFLIPNIMQCIDTGWKHLTTWLNVDWELQCHNSWSHNKIIMTNGSRPARYLFTALIFVLIRARKICLTDAYNLCII